MGAVAADGVMASIVPDEALDDGGQIDGVIGQDVLAARRYTIDFRRHRVVWLVAGEPDLTSAVTFRLESAGGVFLIELPQAHSSLRLVPDSGNEGLMLYRRDDVRLPPLTRAVGHMRMSTLSAAAVVQPIRVVELRVGPTNFVDLPAVLIDRNRASAPEGDGLLPVHLFERVTFDGPQRRLIVQ